MGGASVPWFLARVWEYRVLGLVCAGLWLGWFRVQGTGLRVQSTGNRM